MSEKMILFDGKGNSYSLLEQIGHNNSLEGKAYLTKNNQVIKVFDDDVLLREDKQTKIQQLIEKKLALPGICLPISEMFSSDGKFAGYLMSIANGYDLKTSVFSKEAFANKFSGWTRVHLCDVCLSILDKLIYLQENNIYITDISPLNIYVNSETNTDFIDTDSYQVDNIPGTKGHPLFLAPELSDSHQNILLIKSEQAYYSIAVLIFMIFLNGKNPFSSKGGGSWRKNIKTRNFSYPFGNKDDNKTPAGEWEIIWNQLSYDLKKGFFDVFKNKLRISFKTWKSIINSYKEDLKKNIYPLSIFPSQIEAIDSGKARTLNDGNVTNWHITLRNDRTILGRNTKYPKIAVMELSTKAVKLLMGDQEMINKNGFDFRYFPPSTRPSIYCHAGKGKLANGYMDMQYFESKIIPHIDMVIDLAKANKVDVLYSVATAVYRSSKNRNEIIETIKNKCGVNVKILNQREEAEATIWAFLFSRPSTFAFDPTSKYMMIDQGGGSTEISIFQNQNIIDTFSVDLGSTSLVNIMFDGATEFTTFDAAFNDTNKYLKSVLKKDIRKHKHENINENCIGVGNAIIQATETERSFEKHGKVLSLDLIRKKIQEYDRKVREFGNLRELSIAIKKNQDEQEFTSKKSNQIDNLLVTRIALPIYAEIMEHYQIKNIVVSNTGLWYGIFFQKLFN